MAGVFGEGTIQRCTVHKTRNVLDKAPRALRAELKAKLGRLWNQSSRLEAERFFDELLVEYEATAHRAMQCLAEDRASLLCHCDYPAAHRRTIRTTNA